MAVETRYVVVRGGNEIMTFVDKKAADEYDRMLDMADNLTGLLNTSGIELSEKQTEDLSIFLAKNRDEVLYALMAKKRPANATAPEPAAEPAAKAATKAAKTPRKTTKAAAAKD